MWRRVLAAIGRARARDHRAVRDLYVRGVGVCALLAFSSLRRQLPGLVGEQGISPAGERLDRIRQLYGDEAKRIAPTLLWRDASDRSLLRTARAGQVFGALLALGIAPPLSALGVAGVHLSLVHVGGDFLGFQWESLLVENAVHAALVSPWRLTLHGDERRVSAADLALLRLLLFRLYFESGMVKLRATDRAWVELDAMAGYYETAPLPSRLGWHAHQLPAWLHKASTAAAMAIEVGAPVLGLGTRKLRAAGFLAGGALQTLIIATGNYGFFNLLALAMGFAWLDDEQLPRRLRKRAPPTRRALPLRTAVTAAAGVAITLASLPELLLLCGVEHFKRPAWFTRFLERIRPLEIGNSYGPFSLMTRIRPELTVEGSEDGVTWRPYRFRYKMDDVRRAPRQVAPHQPRLDWLMWFAALDPVPPWFLRFLQRLLEGSKPVLDLLAENPFPERPPKQVRVLRHLYTMTSREERKATGAWWRRGGEREVVPPISLRSFES